MKNNVFSNGLLSWLGFGRDAPSARWSAIPVMILLLCCALPAPARAGFYEDLFGVRSRAAHESAFSTGSAFSGTSAHSGRRRHAAAAGHSRRYAQARHAGRRLALHVHPAPAEPSGVGHDIAALASKGLDAISAILNDQTLRPGDAYVGTEGVRIFVGSSARPPTEKDFVPAPAKTLAAEKFRARLAPYHSKTPDRKLAAIETRPTPAPLPMVRRPGPDAHASGATPAPGRLPASTPLPPPRPAAAPERLITDSSGKTIRLVGAYVPL